MVGDAEGLEASYPKSAGSLPRLRVDDPELAQQGSVQHLIRAPAPWKCAAARSSASPVSPAMARTSCSHCSAGEVRLPASERERITLDNRPMANLYPDARRALARLSSPLNASAMAPYRT